MAPLSISSVSPLAPDTLSSGILRTSIGYGISSPSLLAVVSRRVSRRPLRSLLNHRFVGYVDRAGRPVHGAVDVVQAGDHGGLPTLLDEPALRLEHPPHRPFAEVALLGVV